MADDVFDVIGAWLTVPGLRFVSTDAKRGKPVFFSSINSGLLDDLNRHRYILVAGEFSVDIEVHGGSFVKETSGPLLYFRVPSVIVGEKVLPFPSEPATSVVLKEGYLGIQSAYYFDAPSRSEGPTPLECVRATYRLMVQLAKGSLQRHGEAWIGRNAEKWIEGGRATLMPPAPRAPNARQ
jgi:hypothetical protein